MAAKKKSKGSDLINLRAGAIRQYCRIGIKTEQDLRRFCAAVAGTRWLETHVCKNHTSPWAMLKSAFFEEEDEILGVGPRGGFKTQTVGLLNAIETLVKPGIQIIHAAASIGQAKRAHEWTKRYLVGDAVRLSGAVKDAKLFKHEITLKNGSRIEVLPATTTGLNAPHCLSGDTWIETPSGGSMIRDLVGKTDFSVFSWDGKKFVVDRVRKVWKSGHAKVLKVTLGQTSIVMTDEHRIWEYGRGWVEARKLRPGDRVESFCRFTNRALKAGAGGYRVVTGFEYLDETEDVFDIETDRHHSFVANGIVVHNSHKVRLDEFELIKPEVLDEARLIPQSYGGYKRGLLYVSSRKFRNGNVDRLLYDRRFSDVKKFIWCIAEASERCDEGRHGTEREIYEGIDDIYDPDSAPIEVKAYKGCYDCPLLPDCRGQLAKSNGWMSLDDVLQIYGSVTREAWLAQMRSRRVTEPSGRIFKFTVARNVMKMDDSRLTPVMGIPVHITVDFGGGRASTAALFWQEIEGEVRVLAEYVRAGTGPEEDVPAVEQILRRHFAGHKIAEHNTGDSAVPIILGQWNRLAKSFQLVPVAKLRTKTEMVAVLSSIISPASGATRYYVHPRCEKHIEEITNFRHQYRLLRGIRHTVYPDRNVDTVDAATYLSLQVDTPARPQPGIHVLDAKTDRVESSEEPAAARASARKTELENYIGIKLWRLLNRTRR